MSRSDKWDLVRQSIYSIVTGGWLALAIFALSEGFWIGWFILGIGVLTSVGSVSMLWAQVEMIVSRARIEEIDRNVKTLAALKRIIGREGER